jgi:prevent-host-death family protein
MMEPTTVGIREAKINLSKLLKLVRKGREVVLTDRGVPVGKIVPIEAEKLPLEARIRRLESQGVIEPGQHEEQRKIPLPIPIPDDLAQRMLREDRDSGR